MRSRAIIMSACLIALAVGGVVLFAAFRGDAGGGDDAGTQVLLAAGDIAECDHQGDEATASILAEYPNAAIATLGDNAYEHGTLEEFQECYGPSWGKFKDRTKPATGNHDEATKNAQGYWDFFGERGGPYDRYYYSYDLGPWHVVVLNSDCWRVDGCEPDDPQAEWLRRDLQQHPDPKDTERVRPLWRVLYEEGTDVLLTGHEHSYERFAPMNAEGERDDARGVHLFVVGTGGGNLRDFENDPLPTTEVRQDDTWGVLKLTLKPTGYDWTFLPVAGKTFTDSGSATCH
jgi:acid phosphatase type 7